MIGYQPSVPRQAGDRGEYIAQSDKEFRQVWGACPSWKEISELVPLIPTADEWAEHVDYVIRLVGADHVGIGLDMGGGRSGVPRDPRCYGELLAVLNRTTPTNGKKISGENWMRVFETAKA